MDILFLTTEFQGIVKTGGLADVAKALPKELALMGHNIKVVLPLYASAKNTDNLELVGEYDLTVRDHPPMHYRVFKRLYNNIFVWFIDYPHYFDRNSLYDENSVAYSDNGERFTFFTICAMEICIHQNFRPYIVHCNDWHTAIAPFLLKTRYSETPVFENTRSVITVHNGSFQGVFDRAQLWLVPEIYEHYNEFIMQGMSYINLLKCGVFYADEINTVSPGYAQELTTYLGGHGMAKNYSSRADHLRGIVNGCDYTDWDPITDTLIPFNYSADHLESKNLCKHILQRKLGLDINDFPLFGMICRLTEQKGLNILLPILEKFLVHKINLIIIGTGDVGFSQQLKDIASRHTDRMVFINSYDEILAHMTEAAADFFLMPSLYEPCGLNQMYSMSYGTLPIVRAVGGLKDTVIDYDHDRNHASGFVFELPDPIDFLSTLRRALLFYLQETDEYKRVQINAMHTRYYWYQSATQYVKMYEDAHKPR